MRCPEVTPPDGTQPYRDAPALAGRNLNVLYGVLCSRRGLPGVAQDAAEPAAAVVPDREHSIHGRVQGDVSGLCAQQADRPQRRRGQKVDGGKGRQHPGHQQYRSPAGQQEDRHHPQQHQEHETPGDGHQRGTGTEARMLPSTSSTRTPSIWASG